MEAVVFNVQRFSIHDGPGIRTTVFFKGCNLHCGWCCNPEALLPGIQLAYDVEKCTGCGECAKGCFSGARNLSGGRVLVDVEKCILCSSCINTCINGALWSYGTKYTVDELMTELLKDKAFYVHSGGGVTLSGGEVLLQADFAAELCDRLHEENIQVAAETAAAVPPKTFTKLLGKIDLWHIDFKHYDSLAHKTATGIGNELTINNIKRVIDSGADYIIRIPVIFGFNDSVEDARRFSDVLKEWGVTSVQLMPFHQLGERKYAFLGMDYGFAEAQQLHKENLTEVAKVFDAENIKVQIGG